MILDGPLQTIKLGLVQPCSIMKLTFIKVKTMKVIKTMFVELNNTSLVRILHEYSLSHTIDHTYYLEKYFVFIG